MLDALVLQAMLLRASYGGMQGDQAMLRRYADLWQHRRAARIRALCTKIPAPVLSRWPERPEAT